eukprot:8419394-Ditylum_brightwellii.AAC.1
MPCAVEFSTWMGVAGYWCPSSFHVSYNATASLEFSNNAPSSASVTDVITLHRIVNMTKTGPFFVMVVVSLM